MAALTYQQIRDYLADSPDNNHLLDGEEFTDSRIDLAMTLAVSSYNTIPPTGGTTIDSMGAALLLYGTLHHLYLGQTALAARNQMSYSDGGLTIPIEERYQYYVQMADMYGNQFKTLAKEDKISRNMEAGWGSVQTDYASFPIW
ncbi:hypothetical protein VPHD148_0283 [Vibrio phage D148]